MYTGAEASIAVGAVVGVVVITSGAVVVKKKLLKKKSLVPTSQAAGSEKVTLFLIDYIQDILFTLFFSIVKT